MATSPDKRRPSTHSYLFAIDAKSGDSDGNMLTLSIGDEVVMRFTDRPDRFRDHLTVGRCAQLWRRPVRRRPAQASCLGTNTMPSTRQWLRSPGPLTDDSRPMRARRHRAAQSEMTPQRSVPGAPCSRSKSCVKKPTPGSKSQARTGHHRLRGDVGLAVCDVWSEDCVGVMDGHRALPPTGDQHEHSSKWRHLDGGAGHPPGGVRIA